VFYCFASLDEQANAPGQTAATKDDPIDSLVSLLALAPKGQLDLNLRDKRKRAPLHYAAIRGATICSLKLITEKAEIDPIDEDGNTPLTLSFLAGYVDYSIVLLQRNASCHTPVRLSSPALLRLLLIRLFNHFC